MIVRWKMVSALEFAAHWEDLDMTLSWDSVAHNWLLRVNGMLVKQRWTSSVQAIEEVDYRLNKRLKAVVAVAQQRPSREERIVRHASA